MSPLPEGDGPEQVRRLKSIVEHTTNMVVLTNRRREILWVNAAYTEVTGWTLDEVRGRNPRSFLHGPRTSWRDSARLGSLLSRGQTVTDFEILNYKKSGETYWVSLSIRPVFDEQGQVTEFVSIQADISERKRRDAEIRRTQWRLEQALRFGRLAWFEHDLSTGQVLCSPEVSAFFGIASRGRSTFDLTELVRFNHPDDADRVAAEYARAVNDGLDYVSEHRVRTCAGEVRWVHMRGSLEGWEDGRPAVMRLVAQDITERKLAERVSRANEVLEQTSRTQIETLSRVTHELRAPLRAVLGFAEMLERTGSARPAERSRGQLAQIRDAARHLLHLVDDMQDFVRLRGQAAPLPARAVDLHALALDVVAVLQPLAAAHRVELSAGAAMPGCIALADPQRLRQVLINLVANAIRYNRPGGSVEVTLQPAEGASVGLAVNDTGVGIEAGHLPHLFEPFYRVGMRAPGTGVEQGSGLGLAIAKALIEAMGGEIGVTSTPGAGSCFGIRLPQPPGEGSSNGAGPGRLPLPPVQPAANGGPQRILFIDDSEFNTSLLEAQLEDQPQWQLHCRHSVADGLTAARQLLPDLILLDLDLPDGNGFDALHAIRSDPLLCRVPCVAFSTQDQEAVVLRTIQAGFREFLRKPADRAEIVALFERLLPG